jgi:hypothetical protein
MSTVADGRREAPSLRCGRPRAGATLGDRKRAAEEQQNCFALPTSDTDVDPLRRSCTGMPVL